MLERSSSGMRQARRMSRAVSGMICRGPRAPLRETAVAFQRDSWCTQAAPTPGRMPGRYWAASSSTSSRFSAAVKSGSWARAGTAARAASRRTAPTISR